MSAASETFTYTAEAGEQRIFVDTNILLYAYDNSAGVKRERARQIVEDLWQHRNGCVSVQVLQEFFVNVTCKIPHPLALTQARQIVADLGHWRLHRPSGADVVEAINLHERLSLSFWDAMIVCSAASLGCGRIYSEDLAPGESYAGVLLENPLAKG